MMDNSFILKTAMRQSAIDLACSEDDFLKFENVCVISKDNRDARRYLSLPFVCNLVSYGNNVVASVSEDVRHIVQEYISKYPTEHQFETPNMHVLSNSLKPLGFDICFMAEYFLPDMNVLRELECGYELKILEPKDFQDLYTDTWSNALCEKRKHLDVLAVGAYDNGELVGLAGCSADCDTMWQIGIDVLPKYRRQGIASCLTAKLALETIKRGKVPFYCAAWSNIKSVRNAIKAGFKPAWVEMTAKEIEFIENMNK